MGAEWASLWLTEPGRGERNREASSAGAKAVGGERHVANHFGLPPLKIAGRVPISRFFHVTSR